MPRQRGCRLLAWKSFTSVVILCLIAPGGASLTAQTRATTGDLVGLVADTSQAVLPGVTVTATNTETNLTRSVTTDPDGRYAIPALPPGPYSVKAELPGFAPETRPDVTIQLGTTANVDFSLKVAGQAERVDVTGELPLVDATRTVVATVVSQQQIESLPINGRNFISFSVITPGVSSDQTPQQGASATSGLTFAGQRARSNNITVDGLDNNDITIGSVRATFSQEAVREFQVLTNSYSAEFGKACGGVVNIVTRSGTNRPSGNAFFYGRDEALNAKNHFEKFAPDGSAIDRPKAPFQQKQFGGILGGPLVRDRTFYFASFERLDQSASNFVTIDDTTPIVVPGLSAMRTPRQILEGAGFPVDSGNVPYDVRSNALLAKVDHQLSPDQRLTVRYTFGDGLNENIEPFGGQVARSRAAALDSEDHMVAASHTAVFSNRLVNELRFQFARRDQNVYSLDPSCDGICDTDDEGGPTLEIVGFASVGRQRFTPQPRLNDRYQVLDTVSYFRGRHQFKAGFDFNYVNHKEQSLPLHFGGRYIFRPLPAIPGVIPVPISSIQALALGLPAAYVQGYGDPSVPYGYRDLSLFVQDDWRLTDRLTIKAGLRYQNQYWPNFEYRVSGLADPYRFPSDNNNLAPRLAAAWDPTGDQRTSIHASYGIFYDNHITGMAGIARGINGEDKVQTLLLTFPNSLAGWRAPGRKLPREAAPAVFPSVEISIDPGMETPYAHHTSFGVDRELPNQMALAANVVFVRGFKQVGTIDYNPVVPALGANRRPEDIVGPTGPIAGTSASILQYTSFGETWYKGLTVSLTKRFANRHQFLVSYTLSKAEDNATDYQSAFIPQNNGLGRDDANPTGLPVGFNPDDERGPSLQDQRHRFVASGLYVLPLEIQLSSIVTIGSGRPFNILAGDDLNGDGDGGTFPPDRPRANPADPASSIGRNADTLPTQATVDLRVARRFTVGRVHLDGFFEVFNLFNRTNYIEINNIFGRGAFPGSPLPTYGQFTQAGAPLQVQLAARVSF